MNNYTVYFEIFNKKMKITVDAQTETQAKNQICDKIIYHKITLNEPLHNPIDNDPQVKNLMDILGMNKKKK